VRSLPRHSGEAHPVVAAMKAFSTAADTATFGHRRGIPYGRPREFVREKDDPCCRLVALFTGPDAAGSAAFFGNARRDRLSVRPRTRRATSSLVLSRHLPAAAATLLLLLPAASSATASPAAVSTDLSARRRPRPFLLAASSATTSPAGRSHGLVRRGDVHQLRSPISLRPYRGLVPAAGRTPPSLTLVRSDAPPRPAAIRAGRQSLLPSRGLVRGGGPLSPLTTARPR